MSNAGTPPGWYPAPGDPPGTHRYWNGSQWTTGPTPIGGGGPQPMGGPAPGFGFPTGNANAGQINLADPWMRLGARIIDAVIGFVIFGSIAVAIVGPDDFNRFSGFNFGVLLILVILGAAYEVGMVAWKGGTIGKLALGLRVVNQSDRNYPPTLQAAVLRWLPGLVGNLGVIGSLASIVIAVLSIIWIFTDDYRRTVHDRIASTYVIKV